MTSARTCGNCTACCFVMGIDDLSKPPRERCPRQRPGRCGDYENRPAECRAFECGWLAGVGTEADRPDRSGVVLVTGPGWVSVNEDRAGAAESPFAVGVMRRALDAGMQAYVTRRSGLTQLMGKRTA